MEEAIPPLSVVTEEGAVETGGTSLVQHPSTPPPPHLRPPTPINTSTITSTMTAFDSCDAGDFLPRTHVAGGRVVDGTTQSKKLLCVSPSIQFPRLTKRDRLTRVKLKVSGNKYEFKLHLHRPTLRRSGNKAVIYGLEENICLCAMRCWVVGCSPGICWWG